MVEGVADRIRAFAAAAVSEARLPAGAGRLVAVGWATVDTDRAIVELATALGVSTTSFRAASPSVALGASCLVADAALTGGDVALAVIEPATEGRIAAGLARWDEGPLVAWYAAAGRGSSADAGVPAPFAGAPGPFGRERLVGGDPLTGPHRLLVDGGPGTIRA
jgi:hypothetical protein